MNLNNCLNIATKMAASAKPGVLKHNGNIYTFVFDQITWNYNVYENGFEYLRLNCKTLKTAKQYLVEYLNN
jgi:hypothetical protein